MTPRVCVVMPLRDGEPFVREAVESVLAQTFADFELIVVDDGSRDRSPEIVAELAERDPRVRLLRGEARGMTAAINRGWREASGEYVARMDADDASLPERLALQVAYLDAHPDVAVVGTQVDVVDRSGRPLWTLTYPTEPRTIARELLRRNVIAHSSVLVRRVALEAIGGYRFDNAEDYDLWLRLAESHALANVPDALVRYRLHANQFSIASARRQSLAILAVRAAARARRATGSDPLSGVAAIDEELLARLGVTPAEIERALLDDHLYLAAAIAQSGDAAGARALLDSAHRLAPSVAAAERAFRGRLAQAKTAYRSGDRPRALRIALAAAIRHPLETLRAWRAGRL